METTLTPHPGTGLKTGDISREPLSSTTVSSDTVSIDEIEPGTYDDINNDELASYQDDDHSAETQTSLDPDFPHHLSGSARISALREYILARLDDEKAEDIITIDLDGKSEIADTMIIASGRSGRHVSAVAGKVQRALKQIGVRDAKVEGQPACDWVLIDAGDIIIHLFRKEVRDYYNLERIWSEAARAPVGAPTQS